MAAAASPLRSTLAGQGSSNDSNESIWNQLLAESSHKPIEESKTVLVLGDRGSGRSTLLARVQGLEGDDVPKNGSLALGYTFLDILMSEESDDVFARADVWSLEGEVGLAHLLDFGLNERTFGANNCLVVIILDLSQPWNLVDSLQKWLKVLENHIEVLKSKLPKGALEAAQKACSVAFQQYKEAGITNSSSISLLPRPLPAKSSSASASASASTSVTNQSPSPSSMLTLDDSQTSDMVLPLPEGVLTNNLGLPILVVCNKSDVMLGTLEKDFGYKDDHFTYIQQYLRRICLAYGAGLLYTSAKADKNCDVLNSYIKHKLFGFELAIPAQLVDKDSLFIPSGWDSLAKIQLEFSNQSLCNDVAVPFADVIVPPVSRHAKMANYEAEVVAEDDHEFLVRQLKTIEKSAAQQQQPAAGGSGIFATPTKPTPAPLEPTTPVRLPRPVGISTPSKGVVPPLTAGHTPLKGQNTPNEHKVLSDFFTSLISRDPRAKRKPGPSTPATSSGGAIPLVMPATSATNSSGGSGSGSGGGGGLPSSGSGIRESPTRKEAEKAMSRVNERGADDKKTQKKLKK
jgi:dynein light intermediate chain 1